MEKTKIIIEISERMEELYNFYTKKSDETLNQIELKDMDKIRRKIKNLIIKIYPGYYPSVGGFAISEYRIMFNSLSEAQFFGEDITSVSKVYKSFKIDNINEKNYRVRLSIFESNEDMFNQVDRIIGLN